MPERELCYVTFTSRPVNFDGTLVASDTKMRVLRDGTLVSSDDDPRLRRGEAVERARRALPVLLVAACVLASRWLRTLPSAADRSPTEHWAFLKRDVSAMRALSDQGTRRSWLNPHPFDFDHLAQVDYGGKDGHIMQDFRDARTSAELHGTRCSSTRYALTRYFCGAEVADNLNSDGREQRATTVRDALESGFDWSTLEMGGGGESVAQLIAWLDAARATAGGGQAHKRLVYRLGLGQSKPSDPPLSHVWTIVTQPDGTYMWLQSYIQKYSLIEWMVHADSRAERYLSHEALVAKLVALIELMARSEAGWTTEANAIYRELFHVDALKLKTALKWKPSVHSLSRFSWNVACEYLLPGATNITR